MIGLAIAVTGLAALIARFGTGSADSAAPLVNQVASATATRRPFFDGLLPGRATATPATPSPEVTPSATGTAAATSPFTFPTALPAVSPTPARDCTTVFPPDSLQAIEFGTTTIAQLEAAFGQADHVGGRPVRFRFSEEGCTLWITVGRDEALEAELNSYGTLDFLLERYGPPAAVGLSEGNLALPMVDYGILFYPEPGVIAFFAAEPGDLRRDSPVITLYLRPSYRVEDQLRRLNARAVDWEPPLR